MGDFVHRITKQHFISTSPNDLLEPIGNYIDTPNLSAVFGFPSKYWKIVGDNITLLPKPQRDAVDDTEQTASRDIAADELDEVETLLRAFALVVLDEFNVLRSQHGLALRTIAQLKAAVRGKLGR